MKYKIGDKVKIKPFTKTIVDTSGHMDYLPGTIQEVIGFTHSGNILIMNTNPASYLISWSIHEDDLEPAEVATTKKPRKKKILYPVGTRVRIVKDLTRCGLEGRIGTVTDYTKLADKPRKWSNGELLQYGVKLDSGADTYFNVNELGLASEDKDTEVCMDDYHYGWDTSPAKLHNKVQPIFIINAVETAEKEEKPMSETTNLTLRQKVKYFALSKEEKTLREAGFHDGSGALTEQGRRIVVDVLWESMTAAQRSKVVEAVAATLPKEK